VYRGHSGLRDFVDVIAEAAASHVTELDQVRIRDDGVLLIEFTNRVRTGGATAMELTLQGWQEVEFRGPDPDGDPIRGAAPGVGRSDAARVSVYFLKICGDHSRRRDGCSAAFTLPAQCPGGSTVL
jgi:hypothetical protein